MFHFDRFFGLLFGRFSRPLGGVRKGQDLKKGRRNTRYHHQKTSLKSRNQRGGVCSGRSVLQNLWQSLGKKIRPRSSARHLRNETYSFRDFFPRSVAKYMYQILIPSWSNFFPRFLSKISCQIHVLDFHSFLVQFLSEISFQDLLPNTCIRFSLLLGPISFRDFFPRSLTKQKVTQ